MAPAGTLRNSCVEFGTAPGQVPTGESQRTGDRCRRQLWPLRPCGLQPAWKAHGVVSKTRGFCLTPGFTSGQENGPGRRRKVTCRPSPPRETVLMSSKKDASGA